MPRDRCPHWNCPFLEKGAGSCRSTPYRLARSPAIFRNKFSYASAVAHLFRLHFSERGREGLLVGGLRPEGAVGEVGRGRESSFVDMLAEQRDVGLGVPDKARQRQAASPAAAASMFSSMPRTWAQALFVFAEHHAGRPALARKTLGLQGGKEVGFLLAVVAAVGEVAEEGDRVAGRAPDRAGRPSSRPAAPWPPGNPTPSGVARCSGSGGHGAAGRRLPAGSLSRCRPRDTVTFLRRLGPRPQLHHGKEET